MHRNVLARDFSNTLESMRLVTKNAIRRNPSIECALRLQASGLGPSDNGAQSSLQVDHEKADQLKVRSSCITCIDRRNPCDGLRPQCWGCLIYGRVCGRYISHASEAATDQALRPVSPRGGGLDFERQHRSTSLRGPGKSRRQRRIIVDHVLQLLEAGERGSGVWQIHAVKLQR
jgi:hypothetical protein